MKPALAAGPAVAVLRPHHGFRDRAGGGAKIVEPKTIMAKTVEAMPEATAREMSFAPRTLIFLEGDPIDWIYRIEHGTVMLYKLLPDGRRQVVELLGAGDVFGFSSAPVHGCTAETLTATRCSAFDRAVAEQSSMLTRRLNAQLRAQLCAMHDHAMLLGRKSAMERIATFLMRCIPGRGSHGCPGPQDGQDRTDIRIPMSRQEIADYLGITIETVSRNLGKLKRRGILTIRNLDEVCVHDVCKLCRLTGTHLSHDRWCSSRADALIKDPWS